MMDDEVKKYIELLKAMQGICRYSADEDVDRDGAKRCEGCILDMPGERFCIFGIVRTRIQERILSAEYELSKLSHEECNLIFGFEGGEEE